EAYHPHDVPEHRRTDRRDRLDRAALAAVTRDDAYLRERDPLALPLPCGEGGVHAMGRCVDDDRRGDLAQPFRARVRPVGHRSPSAGFASSGRSEAAVLAGARSVSTLSSGSAAATGSAWAATGSASESTTSSGSATSSEGSSASGDWAPDFSTSG